MLSNAVKRTFLGIALVLMASVFVSLNRSDSVFAKDYLDLNYSTLRYEQQGDCGGTDVWYMVIPKKYKMHFTYGGKHLTSDLQSVTEMVSGKKGVTVAINSQFLGYPIVNGVARYELPDYSSYEYNVSYNNAYTGDIDRLTVNAVSDLANWDGISFKDINLGPSFYGDAVTTGFLEGDRTRWTCMGLFNQLVMDGVSYVDSDELINAVQARNGSTTYATDRHPRTWIAYDYEGDQYIGVATGRASNQCGLALGEMIDITNSILPNGKSIKTLYNVDGGGSSTFWYHNGGMLNPKISDQDHDGIVEERTLRGAFYWKVEDQEVRFENASVTKTFGDSAFTNAASVVGDGNVTYTSSATNVATVGNGGTVTIKGVGTATITATAAETDTSNSASASYNLTVNKAQRTISFANTAITKTFGDSAFTNVANVVGDGNVTYASSANGVATVDNNGKVTIKGAGVATITATVGATANYEAGTASYTLTVKKAPRNISFTNTTVTKTFGDSAFTNVANVVGDGNVTYASSANGVATVDNNGKVTIKGAGVATITATAAETSNYLGGTTSYTLTVNPSSVAISFNNTSVTKTYGDAAFSNVATTISGGAVTYSSNNTSVATVDNNGKVTIRGAGIATITANVAATSNYKANSAMFELTVLKKTSEIPEEIANTKTGYYLDELDTLDFGTVGLSWADASEVIDLGANNYSVRYIQNNDSNNYTTEIFDVTVVGERRTYGYQEGGNQTFIMNSDKSIQFVIDADWSSFEEGGTVYIDQILLDKKYYNAKSGSVVLSISNDYLQLIGDGKHDLAVYFNDGGVAETSFVLNKEVINDNGSIVVPNTGMVTTNDDGIRAVGVFALVIGPLMILMIVKVIGKIGHKKIGFEGE